MSLLTEDRVETVTFSSDHGHIYSIPALKSNAGHRSSEWDLREPLWTGRATLVEIQSIDGSSEVTCELRLDDPNTHEIFAVAPYSNGKGIQIVNDSSRFFSIRVVDGDRTAVLGLGFPDRSIAFEFNIALQDFKKHSTPVEISSKTKSYSLMEGQTIHVNVDTEPQTSLPLLPPPSSVEEVLAEREHEKEKLETDQDDEEFGDFV